MSENDARPPVTHRSRDLILEQRSKIRLVHRIVVTIIGGSVILIGLAMVVLPGPALVVIPLGLAILASEFIWARQLLIKARELLVRRTGGTSSTAPQTRKAQSITLAPK